MTARPKILFVAMQTSVHAARWIAQAASLDYECHVFPLDAYPPHHKLANVTLHIPTLNGKRRISQEKNVRRDYLGRAAKLGQLVLENPREALRRIKNRMLFDRSAAIVDPLGNGSRSAVIVDMSASMPDPVGDGLKINPFSVDHVLTDLAGIDERNRLGRANESDETALRLYGPEVLAALIEELKPDLIHSMEFQHAGYLVLGARDRIAKPLPAWLATNWGSDIYYFGKNPDHALQIRRLCEAIDLYSCECHRDLAMGRQFGYRGPNLPVLPNSGGIDIEQIVSLRGPSLPSARKLIMVKGYDHFAGRAMVALDVLERFADQLRDYTIVLFSVGARPRARAIRLAEAGTLNVKIIDWAPHDEILSQFGLARLYLGISISDAISTSVLEAMAMGAFPIQTDTSCCTEWFIPEKSGFAVPVDNFDVICDRFKRALTDDALVDEAATINLDIIRSRLAIDVFVPKMRDFYAQAFAHARRPDLRPSR